MYSIEDVSNLLQKLGVKKDLRACLRVYSQSVEWGLDCHGFLGGHFIRAFESCGSLFEASKHFLRLHEPNVFSWSAIISAHVSEGFCEEAIQLYKNMIHMEATPDAHTFVATLKACSQSLCLMHGMLIHHHIIESNLEFDCHIGNTLVDLYGKNCCVHDAGIVFGRLKGTDVVTWNAIISGYAREKNYQEALQLFLQMEVEGIKPDNVTIVNILKACRGCASLYGGKLVHAWIIEKDFDVDAFVWSTLIDMYAKCDHIKDAQKLFDSFSTNDEVTWSTMIAAYVVHSLWEEAFSLFKKMQCLGIQPGRITFLNVLRTVSETSAFEDGRLAHAYVVERAYDHDDFVVSSLVDMYSKCSSLLDARGIFENSQRDNPAAWGAIIAGYLQHGAVKDAFHLIDTMKREGPKPHVGVWNVIIAGCVNNNMDGWAFTFFKQMEEEGFVPDSMTLTALVKACWCSMNLERGRIMNSLIVEDGFDRHTYVGNSLIDMYAKFAKLEEAHHVFLHLWKPDAVSWNTLIEGYAQHQRCEEAILQYRLMRQSGFQPDKVTVLSVLKASAVMLAIEEGMSVHVTAILLNCESDGSVGSSLIDMYARCGMLNEASKVFESFKGVKAAWNSMISGLACNGSYRWDAYASMRSHGIEPDHLTYLCLLSACSHMGLVHEGCTHFVTMSEHWKIKPTVEHYGCMVDLWGRVGCLKDAYQVLMTSPWQKSSVVSWFSLMYHAQVHGRFDLAKVCLDQIVQILGCKNEAGYMLMASFFCDARLHEHFDGVRSCNLDAKWRMPGHAFIEAQGRVHTFVVGDETHEGSQAIYAKLKILSSALRCEGFVPHASMLMQRLPLPSSMSTHVENNFCKEPFFADRGAESLWCHSLSSVS